MSIAPGPLAAQVGTRPQSAGANFTQAAQQFFAFMKQTLTGKGEHGHLKPAELHALEEQMKHLSPADRDALKHLGHQGTGEFLGHVGEKHPALKQAAKEWLGQLNAGGGLPELGHKTHKWGGR